MFRDWYEPSKAAPPINRAEKHRAGDVGVGATTLFFIMASHTLAPSDMAALGPLSRSQLWQLGDTKACG